MLKKVIEYYENLEMEALVTEGQKNIVDFFEIIEFEGLNLSSVDRTQLLEAACYTLFGSDKISAKRKKYLKHLADFEVSRLVDADPSMLRTLETVPDSNMPFFRLMLCILAADGEFDKNDLLFITQWILDNEYPEYNYYNLISQKNVLDIQ